MWVGKRFMFGLAAPLAAVLACVQSPVSAAAGVSGQGPGGQAHPAVKVSGGRELTMLRTAAGLKMLQSVADGTDPNSTGCAASGETIYSVSDPVGVGGLLELRFSYLCNTAWARFTCEQNPDGFGCLNYKVYIRRDQDGVNYWVTVNWPHQTNQGQMVYTLQLNDGAGQSAKACYYDTAGNVTACTPSF
jgi:hypothetical protein